MIKEQIQEDVKTAMREQNKERLAILRLITAAIKQREVDERITLTDSDVLATLDKMVKQRRQSIEEFQKGNRPDLVEKEQTELDLIQKYLPAPLSDQEIKTLIESAIQQSGAASAKDMGKVMAILKPQIQGRTDIGKVSGLVKEKLG